MGKHISKKHITSSEKQPTSEEITLAVIKDSIIASAKMCTGVVKKHSRKINTIIIILSMLLVIFAAISYRTGPENLDITDRWAAETVQNFYYSQVLTTIRAQYPQLQDSQLQAQASRQVEQLLANPENAAFFQSQVANKSIEFRAALQDERNHTYLLAIDPYYFLRLTRNYLQNGYVGEYIADNGKPASRFVTAPSETYPKLSFHVWFQATVFKIVSLFSNITLDDLPLTVFYTPVIVMAAASLIMFLLLKRLTGTAASLLGALYLAVHPVILTRTMGGFSDTDSYNIFFPLLVVYFVILSLQAKKLWQISLWSGLAGISLVVFHFAWPGYLFIFYILGAALGGLFIVELIWFLSRQRSIKLSSKQIERAKKALLPTLVAGAVFGIVAVLEITVRSGFLKIIDVIFGFLRTTSSLKNASISGLWPNVYTTVAELNSASYNSIVQTLGGKFLFYGGMVGVLCFAGYALWNAKHNARAPRAAVFTALMFVAWYGSMIFASLKGIRFTIFLVPVVAMGIALFWGTVNEVIISWCKKSKEFDYRIASTIVGVLIVLTIFMPTFVVSDTQNVRILTQAKQINEGQVPSMNDAWYNALKKIEAGSEPDAIISSWWDFGHQFITIANRGATADGGSQNTPQAYWLGKILVENNSQQSLAVLRMLDCGANDAWDLLDEQVSDNMLVTIPLLNDVLSLNRDGARDLLQQKNISADIIEQILSKTHCVPPEGFVIASQDMISKAGVWAHFGLWDFEKANLRAVAKSKGINAVKPLLAEKGYTGDALLTEALSLTKMSEEAANAYIAPFPQYFSDTALSCSRANETVFCRTSGAGYVIQQSGSSAIVLEGLAINGTSHSELLLARYINGQRSAESTSFPLRLDYITPSGETITTAYEDGQTFGVSYDETTNKAVIADELLSASTFTKLFFYRGNGANYFELFDEQTTIFGQKIYVYKIDWDGYLASIGDS